MTDIIPYGFTRLKLDMTKVSIMAFGSTKTTSFSTGLDSLDHVLKGLQSGDNVVFQTEHIQNYLRFAVPFCQNALGEGKKLVYFRFADHDHLLPEHIQAECYQMDPRKGFEECVSSMLDIIEKTGRHACYLFDCISGLAENWYSDKMLGNFFMLICPSIYEFGSVAYFWLKEDHHTPLAVEAIHDTAQVVLDIFHNEDKLFILPIKVLDRHSPTMYMLHSYENKVFEPVTKSAIVSDILADIPQPWIDFNIDRRDIWTRRLIEAQRVHEQMLKGKKAPGNVESLKRQLIRMIVTKDENLVKLCVKWLDIANIICIGKRMIGTGLIGGKSAGMLLARIILKKTDENWQKRMESHDSFYIGSDVFLTFVIQNGCWWDRRELEFSDTDFSKAEKLQHKIRDGKFSEDIIEEFKEMLHYFGQSPIIVRSSSLLEDAYGNAFSGKYESVFLANQGTPWQRLENFINAVKRVYASTISRDALSYRKHRDLLNKEEQMALLVQRVSGTFYGDFYLPHIAGVGYSFNPFVWNRKIDPSQGVLRMVFGLGTHAVDSIGDDYTRITSLSAPLLRPEMNFDAVRKYTQKIVDVLDLERNDHRSCEFKKIVAQAPDLPLDVFATQDSEILERAKQYNMKNVFSWVLTFDKLLTETQFVDDMRLILKTIETAYNHPVDIEFAVNFISDSEYRINLLQCRPFQISREVKKIAEPTHIKKQDVILSTDGPIIGQSAVKPIHRIIYVAPEKYGKMSMTDRYSIARLIGDLSSLRQDGQKIMLIGPGRWGTTIPALGIPVSFAEIKYASIICEVAAMHEGLTPDISLGTHFFNDLVEVNIVYIALLPGKAQHILKEDMLTKAPNLLPSLMPEAANWSDSVFVIDTDSLREGFTGIIHVDTIKQKGMLFLSNKDKL